MAEVLGSGRSGGVPRRRQTTPWYRRRMLLVPPAVVAIAAAVVLGVPYLHGNPWLARNASATIVAIKVLHTFA